MSLKDEEKEKYEAVWANPEYSLDSPGARCAERFVKLIKPQHKGCAILDLGCGTGRTSRYLCAKGFRVIGVDITDKGIEFDSLPNFCFMQACLWEHQKELVRSVQYGFCSDVMEHIPPVKVKEVLNKIKSYILKDGGVFFNINTVKDTFGETIGQPLHLSVMPVESWTNLLIEVFGNCVILKRTKKDALLWVTT